MGLIRVGFFEDFKGAGTLLIDVKAEGLRGLITWLHEVMSSSRPIPLTDCPGSLFNQEPMSRRSVYAPLPPWLPSGERHEGETRGTVRRRTCPVAADGRLHAAPQRVGTADLEGAKASVREQIASAERAAKTIQDKLDRLEEAFLFKRSIDIETYDRHVEKRKTARGAHARSDRAPLRPARTTRRRGNPGLRQTRSTARRRSLPKMKVWWTRRESNP